MNSIFRFGLVVPVLVGLSASAQSNFLSQDEHYAMGDVGEDPASDLNAYEAMNAILGGDSIRLCGGHPCIGWVEDQYTDGTLKHRGYYDQGKLTLYKNYHSDGKLEREFRSIDAVKSVQRTYHVNGELRSEAKYVNGLSITYEDHYLSGVLRYAEERHRSEPYYIRMDLFAADGKPISQLQLVDKKRVEFVQKEFYPGGALKCEGHARYDPSRMDSQRIGSWVYYDASGAVVKEEAYLDGKVAAVN
ncbi:MAG: hypothetical protein IPH05_16315 [Flavobacteriales bacterium]|nr:hypothetical protein [Flavobacteriales bacterium]